MRIQLKEYTDRFPNKEHWHQYQISIGTYLPKLTCYKWAWGIEKGLKNLRNLFSTLTF